MKTIILILSFLFAGIASAQPQVDARSLFLGATGSICALRTGSGAPSSGLGIVCDVYIRKDSPYTIFVKTAGATWSEIYRAGGTDVAVADGGTGLSSYTTGDVLYASGTGTLAGRAAVAAGQVLASAGTNTAPAWSAAPSLTSIGGTANLTLSPTGDLITAPTGNDILPNVGYTKNIGALTNKYLTLHAAELWVETLVAQNTIATIGGRILVGPTTTLIADLSSAATTINVKHNQMTSGDVVYMEADGKVEFMAVTSSASGSTGNYTYTVTRSIDPSSVNEWFAGDAIFNTGQYNIAGPAKGYIDLYSVSGVNAASTAGPTIVGNVRTGNTYSNIEPRWAIGNLNGLYGYSADTYGSAFGDVNNAWVKIDPTNGVRIGENATTYFQVDPAGNATFSGSVTVGSGGRNQITNSQMMRTVVTGSDVVSASSDGVHWSTGNAPGSNWSGEGVATTTGLTTVRGCTLGGWFVNGSGSCHFRMVGTPPAATYSYIYGPAYPVTVGDTYEFSFYCGNHRGTAVEARIHWYNSAGTIVSTSSGASGPCSNNAVTGGGKIGGTAWDTWGRAFIVAVAPAGAVRGLPIMQQTYSGNTGTFCAPSCADPYLFYTRLYFGQAATGQTTASHWSAAGISQITGEHLSTDLVVTNRIQSAPGMSLSAGPTGFWLDASVAAPTFRIGNPTGNQLKWDGTNLTLTGALTNPGGTVIIDSSGMNVPMNTSQALLSAAAFRMSAPDGGLSGLGGGYDAAGKYTFLQVENDSDGDYGRLKLITKGETDGGTEREAYIEISAGYANGSDLLGEYVDIVADFVKITSPTSTVRALIDGSLEFITNMVTPQGGISKTAIDGIAIKSIAGTTRDFTVYSPGGDMAIGTKGVEVAFGGVYADGTGKVLCVKSDFTIGTCNATTIGASTCTCG